MDVQFCIVYYVWIERVLFDYKNRYISYCFQDFFIIGGIRFKMKKFLYDVVEGYFIFDVINFGNLNKLVNFLSVYFVLLRMFKLFVSKKMVIFFFVDLIIFGFN